MSENDLKAAFGVAYVRAVAHAAGYFTQDAGRERDGDGVDLEVFSRDRRGAVRSPSLQLQIKATHAEAVGDPIPFDLEAKNYTELIDTRWQVPRILVAVFVPGQRLDWLSSSPESLVLRRAGYWLCLRGRPATANSSTTRIVIPRDHLLDVAAVAGIMQRIREGNLP